MTARFAALAVALALASCSKEAPTDQEAAKTPEQIAAEQAEAREQAKQGPMGEPIKALDKAATVQGTVDQQGKQVTDAVEQQSGDASADAGATAAPPPPK